MRTIWKFAAVGLLMAFTGACQDDDPIEVAETLASFDVSAPADIQTGDPFNVTVTAVGSQGTRPFTGFSGDVGLSVTGTSGATISPTSVTVSNGVGTTEAVITGAFGPVTLEVSGSGASGAHEITVDVDPARMLPGDPSAPAADAIPDQSYVADEDDYTADHPDLGDVFVSFNTLILAFELDVTVGDANDILTGIDAEIVGGVQGAAGAVPGILMLQVPTTSHGEMSALLDDLRADARVAVVAQDALLETDLIPGPNAGDPANWTWSLTPAGGNWGLELVRAPSMWNLNAAVTSSGNTTVTGVFDTGFADSHPDLVYAQNLTPGNQGNHGTHVAGTIGATFDNGIGVDGINPFADLVVGAITIPSHDGSVFSSRESFGAGFLTGFADMVGSRSDIRVVNISMGYNWGPAGVNQGTNATAQQMVIDHARLFRTLLIILSRDVDLPIIVPAAGNDSNHGFGVQEARWGSPFNYAGLVLDPPDATGTSPIIVVESIRNDVGGTGGATRSVFSNTGGNISAPGSDITSTSWSVPYQSMSGTSMAAPHVTGLIGYLYALKPDLTHAEVRELLFSTAIPVGGGASSRIDAYGAVLAMDRLFENTTIRGKLLDVTGDGAFTEADITEFLAAFDACEGAAGDPSVCPIYSRFNLNGSGITGEGGTSRFDLNVDGSFGTASIMIQDQEVTFDQTSIVDLDIVCYYAYSEVYAGSTEARSTLLDDRCRRIRLVLDEPIEQEVTLNLPDPAGGELGADVMFNVDLSGSFGPDLNTFRTRASQIVAALQTSLADLRVGITSFVDAPCSGFGSAFSGDYGHKLDLALTDDFDEFQLTLDSLRIYSGADLPESQLESMYQSMTGHGRTVEMGTVCDGVADIDPSTPGWTVDRLRFLMHSTDAPFHTPASVSGGVPYPYPTTVADVITTAQETGTTIFILDSGGRTDAAKHDIAEATGGDVFLLDTASSQIVEALEEAAEGAVASATIRLIPEGDDAGFIQSIEPPVFHNINLRTQRTVTFTVTFVNTVTPQPFEQVFQFYFVATVNGAEIERRPVTIVIPAS